MCNIVVKAPNIVSSFQDNVTRKCTVNPRVSLLNVVTATDKYYSITVLDPYQTFESC